MSFSYIRKFIAVGVALGALGLAATASATTLRGVVVQHNKRAHSIVLALRNGRLVSVHARRSVTAGRRVTVSVRRLRNGTYASRSLRTRSHFRRHVLIKGVVTFVNRRRGLFTVSAEGASLLFHTHRGRASAAHASNGLPSVGETVSVQTQIDDQGNLDDQGIQNDGSETQNIDLEGTIQAIDTTSTPNTLTVSADDEDQSGQSVTVDVPSTLDVTMFAVGQEVELTVTLQSDGTYLLVGSSEDGDGSQANSSGDQQGCQGDEDSSCSSSSDSGDDDCQGDEDGSSCSSSSNTSGSGDSSGSDGSDDNQGDQ